MASVIIETSARHVHVTEEDLHKLFGEGYELTVRKELSQPGQFASGERVTIVGPKRSLENVSILGPCRKQSQVEISATDARSIGISAPVRESGDLEGTPGCKLVGPAGEVDLEKGVIVAKRHIHLDTKTAAEFGLEDKQIVCAKVNTPERSLIFGDVVVRVSDSYAPAMHVDTDEGNAAGISGTPEVEIIK
ncbi:MAG: phosphate propanoyltransferase [Oscillospiraceae bacterium]|nr:phosphate propanoyltransferase [Oscillospiraceae bacterium]